MKKSLGVAVLLLSTGCYTTRVAQGGVAFESVPESAEYSHHQWFAIAGAVPLSGTAGAECKHGLDTVESQSSATDILIDIGLSVVGGAVGAGACSGKDSATVASCATTGATLAAFLLSSRTVHYTCLDTGVPNAPNLQVLPPPVAPKAPPESAPSEG